MFRNEANNDWNYPANKKSQAYDLKSFSLFYERNNAGSYPYADQTEGHEYNSRHQKWSKKFGGFIICFGHYVDGCYVNYLNKQ